MHKTQHCEDKSVSSVWSPSERVPEVGAGGEEGKDRWREGEVAAIAGPRVDWWAQATHTGEKALLSSLYMFSSLLVKKILEKNDV